MTTIKTKLLSYERALKAKELETILNLDVMTVYLHTRNRTLPCFRIGTSVRYDPSVICEWYDRQQIS